MVANAWVNTLSGDDVPKQVEAGKKQFAGTEISKKTLGVIGLGAIGNVLLTMLSDLGWMFMATILMFLLRQLGIFPTMLLCG